MKSLSATGKHHPYHPRPNPHWANTNGWNLLPTRPLFQVGVHRNRRLVRRSHINADPCTRKRGRQVAEGQGMPHHQLLCHWLLQGPMALAHHLKLTNPPNASSLRRFPARAQRHHMHDAHRPASLCQPPPPNQTPPCPGVSDAGMLPHHGRMPP